MSIQASLSWGGTEARPTVLVVGNGMVGHRFCERLRDRDPQRRHRVVVLGEEPVPAYDRVHLTSYFADRTPEKLLLGTRAWYEERGIELRTGQRVTSLDPARRAVFTEGGEEVGYDILVLATGSAPFVPPVPGVHTPGVFLYRTLADLDAIIAYAAGARSVAVIGGGLLGLEAARAVHDAGLETHVVEFAPRLMPRQLDGTASALLVEAVRALGVRVHLDARLTAIVGDLRVTGLELDGAPRLDVDLVIISAGIRPRAELARGAGIGVGERGGVIVDDAMRTGAACVLAIGEVAEHRGTVYGLVAPGYEMADVAARTVLGEHATFSGADPSTTLKLLGSDVASFGDPFAPRGRAIVQEDQLRGTYKKLVLEEGGTRLLGGILVGDVTRYGQYVHLSRTGAALSAGLHELGLGAATDCAAVGLPDDALVCSCNNVLAGVLRGAVRDRALTTVADLKACTRAGTGCGGCVPVVTELLSDELSKSGTRLRQTLCEHFDHSRRDLYEVVAATGIRTFDELLARHGRGLGCEVCKPTVASILASVHNEPILGKDHATLQDTNDRFLANIQRNGLYSVVPRIPAGEVTPDQLIALGQVAKKYALYTKITGGQRVDLFGARVEQLPEIWEDLVAAGFESGHAYGKAMRTVKSCVGSTWCAYGVQDSTAFAIRIENRYKGIRAPHKLKGGVSGCVRECAEAQSKDFGLIATERGWNIYVGGNGGASPRHADLLVADVDEDTAVHILDRFIMFYIRTADRLTRTSVWIEKMEGGISHLRDVVVRDSLGIAAVLEAELGKLVASYRCEWTDVLRDPEKRARFRHFANDAEGDPDAQLELERGQPRPVQRTAPAPASQPRGLRRLRVLHRQWVRLASPRDVPENGGIAVRYGNAQLAIFHFAARGAWYATQNRCPHSHETVLARGILGDHNGTPKVACPLHKKTFDLESGACLSDDSLRVRTFPVRVEGDDVFVELPPVAELEAALSCEATACTPQALAS